MLNVTIKSAIAATIAALMLAACATDRNKEASKLLEQANEAIANNDYNRANTLLDSIDHAYPQAIEARREAMHLRPQVIEQLTLLQLSTTDSLSVLQQILCDSLQQKLTKVNNPIEPYFVSSKLSGKNPSNATGIYPRMSTDGRFYIVASLLSPVKSTAIGLSSAAGSIRLPVIAFDGERNDRSNGIETLTYIEAECDTLGQFVTNNLNQDLTLIFYGSRNQSVKLPKEQAEAIAETYNAAASIRELKRLILEKNRLEKQLSTARSQTARTFQDEGSN